MSDGYFEILRESLHKRNHIPSGRQLPRTPPLPDVKRHLDFCSEEPSEDCEESRDEGDKDQNRMFDVQTPVTKTEPNDLNSMLKGMTGYQLTPSDLEFIEKMKEEKLIKKLQGDLEEVQRSLKREMMAAELAYATREKAQAELKKFPSWDELTEWAKVVLRATSPSTETAELDLKSLLATVTEENIQRAAEEKEAELKRMKRKIVDKRRKEAKERGQLEKQIAGEQLKLHSLMSQLSDLKSELAQEEEAYKALERQLDAQEAPEIKAEGATKGQVRRRRERKEAVKPPEKLQDATNQSKSKKNKLADGRSGGKDDQSETLTAKQKSGGPQKKAEEEPREPARAGRGRRKPAGGASQPKNESQSEETRPTTRQAAPARGRKEAAVAAEEAENAGLRRSKRIASRR